MGEILDLSTKKDRPKIKIDGVLYDLMLPTDLELKDAFWLQRASSRIEDLQKKLAASDEYDDSVASEFERTLIRFSDILLTEIPIEVRKKLSDVQRLQICDVYAKLVVNEQKRFFVNMAERAVSEEAGLTSSQKFKDSTEVQSNLG